MVSRESPDTPVTVSLRQTATRALVRQTPKCCDQMRKFLFLWQLWVGLTDLAETVQFAVRENLRAGARIGDIVS